LNQVRDGVRSVAPSAELVGRELLDVRTEAEVEAAPLEGDARAIPLEQLRARLEEVPRDRETLVCCAKGPRSAEASRILMQDGRQGVRYLGGGVSMRVSRRVQPGEDEE